MNLKTPKLSTNFYIIIGTVAFLIIGYLFYMEYYVTSKENRIISTRFRVLDQLGDNIEAKISSYQRNADELGPSIKMAVEKLKNDLRDSSIYLSNLHLKDQVLHNILIYGHKKVLAGQFNNDLEIVDIRFDYENWEYLDETDAEKQFKFRKTETDRYFYFDPVSIETISDAGEWVESDSALVRTEYKNLVRGLIRDDVFSGLIILARDQIVYTTLQSDLVMAKPASSSEQMEAAVNMDELKARLKDKQPGSGQGSVSMPGTILSGEFSDIVISNKKYKLFLKPVKIKGQHWFLAGLMNAGEFNSSARSISPWIIILLSLALILIVLGLPIIKLKVISKTEHLDTGTIINSALSFLFGSSVIVLFLLYMSQNSSHLQNTDRKLKKMSAEIDESLTNEITQAYNQLHYLDSVYLEFRFDSIRKLGKNAIIDSILYLPSENIGYPRFYPYADYLFWAGPNGVQTAYLTPFTDQSGSMTNLSRRDYFNKKDEWFYPADSTRKFRMESILSITSGNHKAAISTASMTAENPVVALSARFYSLIDPIIPKNYGFSIIDETGKVWFHSNKNRNLMENFISECNDNDYLKSAIYNRTSKPIYVNYYNNPHRVFIKPLDHLPLYLITFYNRDNETSFHAQVFTMGLFMITVFFLFIFVQVIILLTLERQFQWKLSKNLIMKITRPMVHLNRKYKFLTWTYLLVAFFTAILMSFYQEIQSFVIIYLVEIIMFIFTYRLLNENQLKARQRYWFLRINGIILVLINIVLFSLNTLESSLFVLAFEIMLLGTLYLVHRLSKERLRQYNQADHKSYIRNYVMLLISIAVLFAVIPTMKFYEIAYDTEAEIRIRHHQVDLMKKREARNRDWNKYYSSIKMPGDSVLQERKNKGIYTRFFNGLYFSADPIPPVSQDTEEDMHSMLDSLVVFLRPFYDDEIRENKYIIFGKQIESNKMWLDYGGDTLVLKYASQTEDPKSARLRYYRIFSKVEKLNFLKPYHGGAFEEPTLQLFGKTVFDKGSIQNLGFWLVIVFVMYLFYHLIKFGVRSIYSIDIVNNYMHESFSTLISHQMLANKDIFVVKLSPKDKTRLLSKDAGRCLELDWSDDKIIQHSQSRIDKHLGATRADRKQKQDEEKADARPENRQATNNHVTVLVDNFEWGYNEPEILNRKLDILFANINRPDIRLIIQSAMHPERILQHYRNSGAEEKGGHDDPNNGQGQLTEQQQSVMIRFERLLNNVIINYIPVRYGFSPEDEERYCHKSGKEISYTGLIKTELGASDYLKQFENAMMSYYDTSIKDRNHENPEEMIIVKINSLTENYYEDLFNSCSDEEQYALFDLADDLIMNQKNSRAIFNLLEKGILIKKCDRIGFMNISFRRFVLSRLSKADTQALEIKIGKEAGTWQGYKITLVLIIAALFGFIAMANQDFLDDLNQLFVAIGGGIAVITGVLGLLSRKSNTSSD